MSIKIPEDVYELVLDYFSDAKERGYEENQYNKLVKELNKDLLEKLRIHGRMFLPRKVKYNAEYDSDGNLTYAAVYIDREGKVIEKILVNDNDEFLERRVPAVPYKFKGYEEVLPHASEKKVEDEYCDFVLDDPFDFYPIS